MDILELIHYESGYHFRKATATEYEGPCPFCQAGNDRFRVWAERDRYWCRVCDRKGDAIQFVRDYKYLSFAQAKEYLGPERDGYCGNGHRNHNTHNKSNLHSVHISAFASQLPPSGAWQDPACDFAIDCAFRLMGSNEGDRARAWLHTRTLSDETLHKYRLGYNPLDRYIARDAWGLSPTQDDYGRNKQLWLPRGVVIPWWVDGDLWGIRIRRPTGEPKYYWLPGGTPALYNADALTANQPVVLVEGEIDALTVAQSAGDVVTPVATGSTHGARKTKWLARLATASMVLVAYDTDAAGEKAAQYWLDALPNAKRWRPYWSDVNSLAQDGVDVRRWLLAGIQGVK